MNTNPRVARIRASEARRRAKRAGEPEQEKGWVSVPLPVVDPTEFVVPAHVPCRTCPKYRLMPVEFGGSPPPFGGLHPRNVEAVQLYRLARRDSRTGMGGHLVDTMSITDAKNAVEAFALQLGSDLHRRNLIQKIMVIDGIATRVRRDLEERLRQAAQANAKPRSRQI
jgi:hypothetical protein